jgi:hypothetical protein
MIKTMIKTLTLAHARPTTHTRRAVKAKAYHKQTKVVEAIAGKSAVYGTVFGGANWALTGLDVIDQTHYLPFALLALGSVGLSAKTTLEARDHLTDDQFEKYSYLKLGRGAMLVFACMFVSSIFQ